MLRGQTSYSVTSTVVILVFGTKPMADNLCRYANFFLFVLPIIQEIKLHNKFKKHN